MVLPGNPAGPGSPLMSERLTIGWGCTQSPFWPGTPGQPRIIKSIR